MAVTLRDIAKHLNLSHATVSFVLNERRDVAIPEVTRDRVFQAARELGYRPNRAARALVSGRTQMVAICVPLFRHPYYFSVFNALYQACQENGYEVLACQSTAANRRAIDWPVDGIFLIDSESVVRSGNLPDSTPVVSIGAYVHPGVDHVYVDLMGGAVQAANHLVSQGCRRIAFVRQATSTDVPEDRETAYENVLRLADLPTEIIVSPRSDPEEVRRTVREYVKANGKPDGFMCRTDNFAMATIRGLADLGLRVPDDCAVVGYDGIDVGEITVPTLTTVSQPVHSMCTRAVEFLLNRLRDPKIPTQSATMTASLVVRESSRLRTKV